MYKYTETQNISPFTGQLPRLRIIDRGVEDRDTQVAVLQFDSITNDVNVTNDMFQV